MQSMLEHLGRGIIIADYPVRSLNYTEIREGKEREDAMLRAACKTTLHTLH